MRNRLEDSMLVIEGTGSDFFALAVDFLSVAADGDHIHLQTRDDVSTGWVFESGAEVYIGLLENDGSGDPGPKSFKYDANPAQRADYRALRRGSRLQTRRERAFEITGNTAGLLSMAEHCLDLAEEMTRKGVQFTYSSSAQLAAESVTFALRRL